MEIKYDDLNLLHRRIINNAARDGMLGAPATYRYYLDELVAYFDEKVRGFSENIYNLHLLKKNNLKTSDEFKKALEKELLPVIKEAKLVFKEEFLRQVNMPKLLDAELNFDEKVSPMIDKAVLTAESEFQQKVDEDKRKRSTLATAKRANGIAIAAIIISLLTLLIMIIKTGWINKL